ncbi:uroporphyrinogen decarboxylase [Acetobacterium wieringae]|uniref:Uroporphyrinogen decarboxylase n=1 Tax=Acetobacterium wieringae TaxID=52694 RepID=A0ABY6HGA0_9FIRM|nr:uroporphyrinogen decarboxylase family protein [Acetobacterium wieringae]UYO63563.1 uroporphyrinogen decarboxylase [Acetobacterium wieringae]VUZ26264.1 Uroporphyrinogen decarboxylase [Acetobacterium wieringae]
MGKDLILKTLRHETVNEVPWVPFSGVHAGFLKGYTAREVLTDGDKLFESLMEVHKLYTPDGMPVIFDLQIEAEILGCELLWAEDNPPSVMSHPYAGELTVPCKCKIPKITDGRIPMVVDVMKRVKAAVGEDTALYGLICGPVTLASHIRGSEFFMDIVMYPEFVKELVGFCVEVCNAMSSYYIEAGMDVIALVDPLISQISPKSIEALFMEPFQVAFDFIRSKGALSSFFVCGDATVQMDVMCRTNPDGISIDENVNIYEAKKITDHYNITIGGNIPLTTTLLFGNQQDNMKYIVDMLDNIDHHNLIVSPGCDMPYNVPIDNTVATVQAIKQTETVRKMIENYEAVDEDIPVELPDYENLEKPLIEIFTLDSATCAACTYMVKGILLAKEEFGDQVEIKEYKYTNKVDIARTKKMGVQHLPSAYINGELKWSSMIPSKQELIEVVGQYL